MRHYVARVAMFTALVVAGIFPGVMLARPADAETVRVGNILLEYGASGDNPLKRAVAEGVLPADDGFTISQDLNAKEKEQIRRAASYFAPLTSQISSSVTAKIYTGFIQEKDGSAFSYAPGWDLTQKPKDLSPNGSLYDIFTTGRPVAGYPAYLADNIIIFQTDSSSAPTRLLLKDDSVMSTMLHELGHAFGILGTYDFEKKNNTQGRFTAEVFTEWNAHLYDVFGKKAEPDMPIRMNVVQNTESTPGVFQIFDKSADSDAYEYPTFKGPEVDALTGGRGMPVMGGFNNKGPGLDGVNALGHPGVMQSIMSYGIIRNMPFTEMELAAFQDMGYDFDRGQFFGKSYYYDVGGNTQINTRGFGAADAPNTTLFGLGTHIMRDNLILTQQADIYAYGYGAGGVRIDGVGNALSIPGGVTVAADGDMGTGLLVSYGSKNSITLGGTLRATGYDGIGAHFGVLAAGVEGAHSHTADVYGYSTKILQMKHEAARVKRDMDGPLVDNFSISGTLAGSKAAVFIEEDAHVAAINLLPGARIEGHIVSQWSSEGFVSDSGKSANKFTDISIGSAGARAGNISIIGDILGNNDETNSLNITQKGGILRFNGQADVSAWSIEPAATLGGESTITLRGSNPLSNWGTIAPGNSIGRITIVGDFINAGTLDMEFDGKGATDTLEVRGNFQQGNNGTVSLSPVPDYYNGSMTIHTADMFSGDAGSTLPGSITAVRSAASPTLNMRMYQNMPGTVTIGISRAADAYSRYADTAGAGSVGRAMPGVASQAQGDMRALLTALDFSAPDGSGVRQGLSQLGPEAYDAAGRAALGQQKEFNILLLRRMLGNESRRRLDSRRTTRAAQETRATTVLAGPSAAAGAEPLSGWTAWISPFGSSAAQQDHGGTAGWASSGVGILGGMERRWDAGLTLGLHLALAGRRTDVNGPHDARAETRGAYIGAQALYGPDGWDGFYLTGQVRLGLEDNEMKRDVAFNGYARHNESRWTGLAGGALLGAGKDWTWGDYSAGPLAWLEYGFVQRPELSETDGQASRLHVDGGVYDSLLLSVGGHLGRAWALPKNAGLAVDLLAAWRHELLDGTFRSGASFRGYGNQGFTSATDLVGRDALLVQGSLRLTRGNNFFAQADLGGEFRTAASSVNAGLSFGWEF